MGVSVERLELQEIFIAGRYSLDELLRSWTYEVTSHMADIVLFKWVKYTKTTNELFLLLRIKKKKSLDFREFSSVAIALVSTCEVINSNSYILSGDHL